MKITRGDTKGFKFQRMAGGQPILVEADSIWFTVKRNTNVQDVILQKTIEDMTFDENGWYHFTIDPEDTNKLKYGQYVYDIEVIQDGYKKTISKGTFTIEEEVTFVSNEV